MFDVGFSELMLIGAVALVVIGPERMPRVARTVGALLGRAQRYVNEVKADIQNEVDLEEFNRIKAGFYDAAKSIEHSATQAREELEVTAESLNQTLAEQTETAATAAVDSQTVPEQMEMKFWPGPTPAAGPANGPNRGDT